MTKTILILAVLVVIGIATYAVISRLDDTALSLLVGGAGMLAVVVIVGLLFITKDLASAYITRRILAQDDTSDLRQMAMIARMFGNPSVNIRGLLPSQQDATPPPVPAPFRDVTQEVEIG